MAKVLITGVCGGIGRELYRQFISKNFAVIGVDIADNLNELQNLSAKYQCDLADRESWQSCLQQIYQQQGLFDFIINNAGVTSLKKFLDDGQESFDKVMAVNFDAIVLSTRFWLEKMQENNFAGRIANMSSIAGVVSPAGMCSYSASKHAVVGFTESLQLELAVTNSPVKLSLITPGFVETEIMKIGQGGLPEKYKYLAESPAECAKKIVSGLLNGEDCIVPTKNAHLMNYTQRFAPALLKKANTYLAKKILK